MEKIKELYGDISDQEIYDIIWKKIKEENKIESSLHSIFILMSLSFYKFDKSNYNIIFYIIQSFFRYRYNF